MNRSIVIAIGGNALLRPGGPGSAEQESFNARIIGENIAEIVQRDFQVVITHGNGPQIGSQLLRSEISSSQTYFLPLDLCVSMTQGEIGCLLQRSLEASFRKRNLDRSVVTLITQVLVDRGDIAFVHPSKPIGPVFSFEMANRKKAELGWDIVEDAPERFRRAVPSPKPTDIVELEAIRRCLNEHMVVIAAGGGGIPVVRDNGHFTGVDAVVDKDRASALLANRLGIERLMMCTDVQQVYLQYGTERQSPVSSLSVDEAERYLDEGQFGTGSMRPKIESALEFLARGGHEVVITDSEHMVAAVEGYAGTHIRASLSYVN